MLSFTTGSYESMFSANGINGDMNVTLWPLQVFQNVALLLLNRCPTLIHLSAEWHPALLWLPGSCPSDLLGSVSHSL